MRKLIPLVMMALLGCSHDPLIVDVLVPLDREATAVPAAPGMDAAVAPVIAAGSPCCAAACHSALNATCGHPACLPIAHQRQVTVASGGATTPSRMPTATLFQRSEYMTPQLRSPPILESICSCVTPSIRTSVLDDVMLAPVPLRI